MSDENRPVLIELDEATAPNPSPSEAPPVPDTAGEQEGAAMQAAIGLAARRPSRLARWFWSILLALLTAVMSIRAYDFVLDMMGRWPVVGWGLAALMVVLVLVLLVIAARELAAFSRLKRLDRLHHDAAQAKSDGDLRRARQVIAELDRLYSGRDETRWGRDRLRERLDDVFEAADLIGLAEDTLLAPLDEQAKREIETAARQVATVTALVPIALADVVAALVANLRMIRGIAEIYGGRTGVLGNWRLARAVMTHLVATGAVAVGDDLIGSIAGGSVLGKLSRRFGEGLVNGALTARVGVAAMEVCRPLPFTRTKRPSVSQLVKRSLTGLFGNA